MDNVSLTITFFVIFMIVACIGIDILRNNKAYPLSLRYRCRRLINWFLLAGCYCGMYIARYNVTFISQGIIKSQIDINDTGYGIVLTIGYWVYMFVSPFTGAIGDYLGPKKAVLIGIFGSGIVNILVGLVYLPSDHGTEESNFRSISNHIPSVFIFSLFYSINFIFQSFATGSINKINTTWYKKSDLGIFSGLFGAIISSAYFFTYNYGDSIINSSSIDWPFIFILPGILLLIFTGLIFFIVSENPPIKYSSHGSDNELIDLHHKLSIQDQMESNQKEQQQQLSLTISSNEIVSDEEEDDHHSFMTTNGDDDGAILISKQQQEIDDILDTQPLAPKLSLVSRLKIIFKDITTKENLKPLTTKQNIINLVCLFCIGFVKEGLLSWFVLFISHTFSKYEQDNPFFTICSALVTVGAMTGGILCGVISDYFFKSKRTPALFIFFTILNFSIIALYFVKSPILFIFILTICFITMFGSTNAVTVLAVLDLGTMKNASMFTGLITSAQYLSSGFSGFILGIIVKHGFGYWILAMIPFTTVATLFTGYNSISSMKKLFKRGSNKNFKIIR
ncbi:hypothetical protein CYY_007950 [Polysphondylium violaceum]|uniref:Major facilitator superfamily (MFS) profile domain-containing protein n=1 Tax=Polysphondylium violaceum TaxID=133409 RepID=A0A8J4PMM6_9MYCE|nr:hypothetical protein CYY_007950 [Polysphondylium violaceum]